MQPFIFARAIFNLCVERPLIVKIVGNRQPYLGPGKNWMLSLDSCNIIAHLNIVYGDLPDLKIGAGDYWDALFIYDDFSAFI